MGGTEDTEPACTCPTDPGPLAGVCAGQCACLTGGSGGPVPAAGLNKTHAVRAGTCADTLAQPAVAALAHTEAMATLLLAWAAMHLDRHRVHVLAHLSAIEDRCSSTGTGVDQDVASGSGRPRRGSQQQEDRAAGPQQVIVYQGGSKMGGTLHIKTALKSSTSHVELLLLFRG
ncbi:UNVERIFIED_CONTAM: hypothetical protein K2H54_016849 [Gekko kuhli]